MITADAERLTYLVTGPTVDHIGPTSPCYALPSLPPPADFPVMVSPQGESVSCYGDHRWRIGATSINFGTDQGDLGPGGYSLSEVNGELLKRCVAWFMYGERRGIGVATLTSYHTALKPIFAFCGSLPKPIDASDLARFFDTLDMELAQAIRPSVAKQAVYLLHELWQARERLGFTLLEPEQIARLVTLIPGHTGTQTQFIPPRIWAYQAGRSQAFLEDFLLYKSRIEAALQEILAAYRVNFGSLARARDYRNSNLSPFGKSLQVRGCTYLGSFAEFAERHGIGSVIGRWLFRPNESWEKTHHRRLSISLLSQYFNAVGLVGSAYVQCFSGMRISESSSLRSICLDVEHDPMLGDIHILSAETTKTTQDDDARWLAAPTVAMAVDAMSVVSRWRTEIAVELGDIPLTPGDVTNPYLVLRAYEPWGPTASRESKKLPTSQRLNSHSHDIRLWTQTVPGLFEEDALRITSDDVAYVRRFSANADMEKYGEGCIWHFTSHQYRRSAAVLMGASQVSLETQQYQFKHLTRAQSGYYRKGFHSLRLNRTFTYELVSTRYELVSVELGLLNGPEYVSPISPARKDQILRFHEVSSGDKIQSAIKKGHLAVKQTLFGVCTRRDICPYGGHDNIVHCPDCNDALLSRRRRSSVENLGKTIAVRLLDAPVGTPLRDQLERSATAIERFMNVTA